MAGTAITKQALGGVACVTGVASIIGWRLPRLTLGAAGVAAVLTPYLATVAITLLFGELPSTAALLSGGAVALTQRSEQAKAAQAAPAEPSPGNPANDDLL